MRRIRGMSRMIVESKRCVRLEVGRKMEWNVGGNV